MCRELWRGRYLVVVSGHACNGCDQGIRLGRADVHHHDLKHDDDEDEEQSLVNNAVDDNKHMIVAGPTSSRVKG